MTAGNFIKKGIMPLIRWGYLHGLDSTYIWKMAVWTGCVLY